MLWVACPYAAPSASAARIGMARAARPIWTGQRARFGKAWLLSEGPGPGIRARRFLQPARRRAEISNVPFRERTFWRRGGRGGGQGRAAIAVGGVELELM